jgi:hypothetical protein
MSIQKKSLVRALKTTKKANLASGPVGKKTSSMTSGKKIFDAKSAHGANVANPVKIMNMKKPA